MQWGVIVASAGLALTVATVLVRAGQVLGELRELRHLLDQLRLEIAELGHRDHRFAATVAALVAALRLYAETGHRGELGRRLEVVDSTLQARPTPGA